MSTCHRNPVRLTKAPRPLLPSSSSIDTFMIDRCSLFASRPERASSIQESYQTGRDSEEREGEIPTEELERTPSIVPAHPAHCSEEPTGSSTFFVCF